MINYNTFPTSIHEKIGFYVYRLINPSNGETFYVGKGYVNRVFDHIKAADSFIRKSTDKGRKQ